MVKSNVSAVVASDLLAEWLKEIPGGLVSTQLYTFNFSLSKSSMKNHLRFFILLWSALLTYNRGGEDCRSIEIIE